MRIVVQRVKKAILAADGKPAGEIGSGLVILVGFGRHEESACLEHFARKTTQLRVFADESGRMNRSLADIGGGLMVIPQFTLYGSVSRGNRPDFLAAMEPGKAEKFFADFISACRRFYAGTVVSGTFGSSMLVEIHNDGPVTILISSDGNT